MNARTLELPAVGQPLEGGIFAGITLEGDQRAALILLPGDERKNWRGANEWAAVQGGALPSRIDMLILLDNLPGEFESAWYWTDEECASNADFAWFQHFSYGGQDDSLKSVGCRCRAVRRVAI